MNRVLYNNKNFSISYFKLKEIIEGTPKINEKFGTITIKGFTPSLDMNTEYKVEAIEEERDKYGVSYKVTDMSPHIDLNNIETQKNFLSAILTEHQVDLLYEKFPNPLQIIENKDIDSLCSIEGIGQKVAEKILNKFNCNKSFKSVLGVLNGCGLSTKLIKFLAAEMGESKLINIVTTNPYILTNKKGFGWVTCDNIAQKMGVSKNSISRITTYIEFKLNLRAKDEGHTYILTQDLVCLCEDNLGVKTDLVLEALTKLRESGKIKTNKDRSIISLTNYYDLEQNIAKDVIRLLRTPSYINIPSNYKQIIKDQESIQGWNYTEEQKNGIEKVLNSNVSIVQGFAGAGKSSIVAAIYRILKGSVAYCQCALSGKASVNLTLVTGEEGMTIHRMLGLGTPQEEEIKEVPYDVIVIDEISMVDEVLFSKVVSKMKSGSKLIMLGDIGQLESIGAGNLMYDLINSEIVPVISLKEVHRQAKASGIISNSIDIWHSRQLFDVGWVGQEVRGDLKDFFMDIYTDQTLTFPKVINQYKRLLEDGISPNEIQIILPMRERGACCTTKVNREVQTILLSESILNNKKSIETKSYNIYVGDKVINVANNYETISYNDYLIGMETYGSSFSKDKLPKTPIMNGNMGVVTKIENDFIVVDFEGIGEIIIDEEDYNNIELGYAITAHKSQGSGFPYVITGIDYSSFMMLNKEMMYTIPTRAKKMFYLFGESKAIRQAIRTSSIKTKKTLLKQSLKFHAENYLQTS